MEEPTDAQKEVQALQARILTLEETITGLKKEKDASDDGKARVLALEKELGETKKEKSELLARIWDGKDRRAEERRHGMGTRKIDHDGKPDSDEHGWAGGHFG